MSNTKTIKFSEDEANALLQLLDVAVKSGGLQAASPALQIASKVQEAFKKEEPKKDK